MLVRLSRIYELEFDIATFKDTIIASVGGFLTGKILEGALSLAKGIFPGIGQLTAQLIQAPISYTITYCIGRAFLYFFEQGRSPQEISREELKEKMQEYKEEADSEFLKSKDEILKRKDDKEYIETELNKIEEELEVFSPELVKNYILRFSQIIQSAYEMAKRNRELEGEIEDTIKKIEPEKEEEK